MRKTYITPTTGTIQVRLYGGVMQDNIGIDTNSYHGASYTGEDTTGDAKAFDITDFDGFELWDDDMYWNTNEE